MTLTPEEKVFILQQTGYTNESLEGQIVLLTARLQRLHGHRRAFPADTDAENRIVVLEARRHQLLLQLARVSHRRWEAILQVIPISETEADTVVNTVAEERIQRAIARDTGLHHLFTNDLR